MTRRSRLLCVLAIIVGGAIALIGSTQTWLTVTLNAGAVEPLDVPGASALPLLAPLSLAALALGLALTVVGRVLRYVFGVLATVIGGVLLVAAGRIGLDHPLDAVAPVVTKSTGLSGDEAIAGLVVRIEGTPWPFLTAVAGLVVLAGGVLTLVTAHRWAQGGRRYQQSSAQPGAAGSRPHDAIDSWDDLSHGDDPTA